MALLCGLAYSSGAQADPEIRSCAEHSFEGLPDRVRPVPRGTWDVKEHVRHFGDRCWVATRPDAAHVVVLPPDWSPPLSSGRRGLINDTFATIAEAERSYSGIADVTRKWVVLLTSEALGAERDVDGDADNDSHLNTCYARISSSAWRGADWREERRGFKFVVAHELAHCWASEHIFGRRGLYRSEDEWWEENGAEYLASTVYPANNDEHGNASSYDLKTTPTSQPYYGVVMYQHYANLRGGREAVVGLMRRILAAPDRDGGRLLTRDAAYYHRILNNEPDAANFFHDFATTHYPSRVSDPGGGFMPRGVRTGRIEHVLNPEDGSGLHVISDIAPYGVRTVDIRLKEGYRYRLVPHESESPYLASITPLDALIDGAGYSDWGPDNPYEITVRCDDKDLRGLVSTTSVEDAVSMKYNWEAEPLDESESCEAITERCHVGVWSETTRRARMRPEHVGLINAALGGAGTLSTNHAFTAGPVTETQLSQPGGINMTTIYFYSGPRLTINGDGSWQIDDPHRITTTAPDATTDVRMQPFLEGGEWQLNDDRMVLKEAWRRSTEHFRFVATGMPSAAHSNDKEKIHPQPIVRQYELACNASELVLRRFPGGDERQFTRWSGP